jgi:hypothetical protein
MAEKNKNNKDSQTAQVTPKKVKKNSLLPMLRKESMVGLKIV